MRSAAITTLCVVLPLLLSCNDPGRAAGSALRVYDLLSSGSSSPRRRPPGS